MYKIIIQKITQDQFVPTTALLRKWAKQTLVSQIPAAELTLRIVDEAEMTELNSTYRHKTGPTNVLSFPAEIPDFVPKKYPLLGDIIICAQVVNEEARAQHKTPLSHWAHMIIHGTLHLLGFDHIEEADAKIMEEKEIALMQTFGFANPYIIND